jgi:predicted CXXCH cytochrome family protein
MRKISAVVAMFAVTAFAGAAFAAGPESMDLPASMGKVTFAHKKHQEIVKNDCKKCHEKGPGKIAALGKDWAHKTCKGCHAEGKKGPTGCKDCHKK